MIAHIMLDEKFTPGFVDFVKKNYDENDHIFLITCSSEKKRYTADLEGNRVVFIYKSIRDIIKMLEILRKSQTIVIHGLFNIYVIFLLYANRLMKKSYWYIWGGDLYDYSTEKKMYHILKSAAVRKLKGVISPFEMDYLLAKKVYGINGEWLNCLLPSTIIKSCDKKEIKEHENTINIMIGNSADSENKHFEMIDKVYKNVQTDYHVYIPLSYGDKEYANSVKEYAYKIFGESVTFLDKFMPYAEYLELLSTIDIAVYGHRRQQAFGNIVQLLSLGTKIYLDSSVSTWSMLQDLGIQLFDVNLMDKSFCKRLSYQEMLKNQQLICEYCSEKNLVEQWNAVFNHQKGIIK